MFAFSETYVMRFHSLAKQNLTHFLKLVRSVTILIWFLIAMPPKAQDKSYRAQKYRREWEKESWARNWLCMSKKGVSKAYCKVCDKDLASGKSELISRSKTVAHMALMRQVESNRSVETYLEESLNRNKVKAELNTVALTARSNVPLRFLDHLLETLYFLADESKTIRDMKYNRRGHTTP